MGGGDAPSPPPYFLGSLDLRTRRCGSPFRWGLRCSSALSVAATFLVVQVAQASRFAGPLNLLAILAANAAIATGVN